MENLTNGNREKNQLSFYIDPEQQRSIGRVYTEFVPNYWNKIKRNKRLKDEVLFLASFDRISWLVYSWPKTKVADLLRWGYHLIILDPAFDITPLTDPIPVRSLNDLD
ncbi:hypothetical protein [Cesiribacter andamanensis]|uniref:Uncharacterized protein n=1 Tax=Cesiribacter andamanensis AMV16 TaxID=1279009 RepID=M7N6A0_9BACT|nr:hypothetical protein [Cesiribacter andamanensis]EMR04158.1 hypothetical protein ADICEAN_00682 [Cesiribacter andamanensis AMV16]